MKSVTFKNKIIEELINANQSGLHDVTYSRDKAREFVEELFSHIKRQKVKKVK